MTSRMDAFACDKHRDAVETESDSTVGRSAEGEGFEDVGEHGRLFFLGDSEGIEHGGLKVLLVNPDGATAKFVAVENDIVGLCEEAVTEFAFFECFLVFGDGAGEGVVNGVPLSFFFIVAQEWEVGDPQES